MSLLQYDKLVSQQRSLIDHGVEVAHIDIEYSVYE